MNDIVVFGASGFSGRLVCEYLAEHAGDTSWAIAGRNREKLEAVKQSLGVDVPILVADSDDESALDEICANTRVVCTTVGPYRKFGSKLAHACAKRGTHYCDITGEVPFIRESIDANHTLAQQSGARIVHACGFDSIPSDLAVLLLREHAQEPLLWVKAFVTLKEQRGAPGGIESAIAMIEDARSDRELRRIGANPYALDPDPTKRSNERDQFGVRYDEDYAQWTAPFVMAMVNTRVVRRSAALLDYGRGFRYEETMALGRGPIGFAKATGVVGAIGAFLTLASIRPAHPLLRKLVKGNHEKRGGFVRVDLLARTESGRRLAAKVVTIGDAGCEPTAMMLGESAISLARDQHERTGVLTPASAMGMQLAERVRRGGMTLELVHE